MTAIEIITLNFQEIRRRSLKLWAGLPKEHYSWRPDPKAMTCLETVRHVLESEHLFHTIVKNRGNLGDYISPWEERVYTNIQDEIAFAESFRNDFLKEIQNFTVKDLGTVEIVRSEKGQRRKLGDYLLRIAYHESVHTGQLLDYMRTIGIARPLIWD
jgi:uncharacterized damage-inducible protein DinB